MDYGALDVILSFDACDTRECMNVTIVDDSETEGSENFLFILDTTPGLPPGIGLEPVEGEIIIFENDGVLLHSLVHQ